MYDAYQEWASRTYGDSAKTKTVTKKKYNRIVKILKGEESSNVENSKFRFWVKAKGFKLGPLETNSPFDTTKEQVLYVPSCKVVGCSSASKSLARDASDYKRVAVVENFYHIIYGVHVEMDGRSGKHAGQKRTYRAVAEMYAFLPREAVTRFLMSCSDCQKRMHLQPPVLSNQKPSPKKRSVSAAVGPSSREVRPKYHASDIDYSLPITTTYLKRMKSLGYHDTNDLLSLEDHLSNGHSVNGSPLLFGSSSSPGEGEESNEMISETNSDPSQDDAEQLDSSHDELESPASDQPVTRSQVNGAPHLQQEELARNTRRGRKAKLPVKEQQEAIEDEERRQEERNSLAAQVPSGMDMARNENGVWSQGSNLECRRGVKRKASCETEKNELVIAGMDEDQESVAEEKDGCEEEEEDEEDDVPGRDVATNCDLERLKAFNMFVRLFVDENLDRMVPISRQPKEKIQAIIESCNRQFPEFCERARKRIRTYLKSCRRTRRHKSIPSKDSSQDNSAISCAQLPVSSSSYHLSSPIAEQILATACDNEYNNAKRMKMGLKPIAVDAPCEPEVEEMSLGSFAPSVPELMEVKSNLLQKPNGLTGISSGAAVQVLKPSSSAHTSSSSLLAALCQQRKLENELREANHVNGTSNGTNGSILSGFDNNMKNKGPSVYSLNPGEMAAVKQLISGYRESAAFLLRSADELENLLFQQPS